MQQHDKDKYKDNFGNVNNIYNVYHYKEIRFSHLNQKQSLFIMTQRFIEDNIRPLTKNDAVIVYVWFPVSGVPESYVPCREASPNQV